MMNQSQNVSISRRALIIGAVVVLLLLLIIWYVRTHSAASTSTGTSAPRGRVPTVLTVSPSAPGTPGPSWGHAGHISSGAGEGQNSSSNGAVQYPGGQSVPFGGTHIQEPTSRPQLYQIAQQEYGNLSGQQLSTAVQDIVAANNYPGGLTPDDTLTTRPSAGAQIIIPQIPYSSLYPPSSGSGG